MMISSGIFDSVFLYVFLFVALATNDPIKKANTLRKTHEVQLTKSLWHHIANFMEAGEDFIQKANANDDENAEMLVKQMPPSVGSDAIKIIKKCCTTNERVATLILAQYIIDVGLQSLVVRRESSLVE